MNDYTLAKEFENFKFIHKSSIILGSLLKFYNDIARTGVTIPEFMGKSAEEKAREHYYTLLNDRVKFNEMYEKCWETYKDILP